MISLVGPFAAKLYRTCRCKCELVILYNVCMHQIYRASRGFHRRHIHSLQRTHVCRCSMLTHTNTCLLLEASRRTHHVRTQNRKLSGPLGFQAKLSLCISICSCSTCGSAQGVCAGSRARATQSWRFPLTWIPESESPIPFLESATARPSRAEPPAREQLGSGLPGSGTATSERCGGAGPTRGARRSCRDETPRPWPSGRGPAWGLSVGRL